MRESRILARSSVWDRGADRNPIIELDESEFSAALRLDIAAARMAAISNPDIPCGIWLTMKVG